MKHLFIRISALVPWVMLYLIGTLYKTAIFGNIFIPILGAGLTLLSLVKPKLFLMGTSKGSSSERKSVNDMGSVFMLTVYVIGLFMILNRLTKTIVVAVLNTALLSNLISYYSYTIIETLRGVTVDER